MKFRIIATVIFSLLLFGCTVKTWPPAYIGMCEQFGDRASGNRGVDSHTKSECYAYFAVMNKDISLCGKVDNLYQRQYCIAGVAEGKKDPSLCEQVIERRARDRCMNVSSAP